MRWFEHFSTETRKIVKDEERIVHFLDEREIVEQKSEWFVHDKWEACKTCDLNPICAGIWLAKPATIFGTDHPGYYDFVEFRTQKLTLDERQKIIDTIKKETD